jgi:hypothetical protein
VSDKFPTRSRVRCCFPWNPKLRTIWCCPPALRCTLQPDRLHHQKPAADPRTVMGITFPTRLAWPPAWTRTAPTSTAWPLGFGFIEVGTVTPRAQPGNPLPRMFRLPAADAVINRMGFNNGGVDAFVTNVQSSRFYQERQGVLGLNIGKNADTPIERAAEDYVACLEKVYPYASYVTVNISSPNTKNLRQLQGASELDSLLSQLKTAQRRLADRHGRYVPVAQDRAGHGVGTGQERRRRAAAPPDRWRHRHQHHHHPRCRAGPAPWRRGRRPVGQAGAGAVQPGDPRPEG